MIDLPNHPDDLGGGRGHERILIKTTIYKHRKETDYLKHWAEILKNSPINLTCVRHDGVGRHEKGYLMLFINGQKFKREIGKELFSAIPKITELDTYELGYGVGCVTLHQPSCPCELSETKRCTHTLLVLGKGEPVFETGDYTYSCSGRCKSVPPVKVQIGLLRFMEVIMFNKEGHAKLSRFKVSRIPKDKLMTQEVSEKFKQWKLITYPGAEKAGVYFHSFAVPVEMLKKRTSEDYVALADKRRKLWEDKKLTIKKFGEYIDEEDSKEEGPDALMVERMDLLIAFAKEIYDDDLNEGMDDFKNLAAVENVRLLKLKIEHIRSRRTLKRVKLLADKNMIELFKNAKPEELKKHLFNKESIPETTQLVELT